MAAAVAGLAAPLAAAPLAAAPLAASAASAGTAQPDVVTQWNQTMIDVVEAAAVLPLSAARVGAAGATEHRSGRHDDRGLEGQEHLQLLAAGHRDPRQFRRSLVSAAADACVPGIPFCGLRRQQATASVLAAFHGNHPSFTVTSYGLPGVHWGFRSFSAAVVQVGDTRIYAGFHFRFSCTGGAALGTHAARYLTGTLLRPASRKPAK